MADFTITSDVPREFIAIPQATVDHLENLMERAALLTVDTADQHQKAEGLFAALHTAAKALESERVVLKAPALAVCKRIDEIAKPFLDGLAEQKRALGERIAKWVAAENARIAEANRLAREAAQAEERRLAAQQEAERCPLDDPETLKPVRVEPPREALPLRSAVTVRKVKRLVIDDVSKIPAVIGTVRVLVPDEVAITALLKVGQDVPGCRLVEVDQVGAKGARA